MHRDRAVVLVADDAPRQMLAGDLPALEIEGVAVAVVRRRAEDASPDRRPRASAAARLFGMSLQTRIAALAVPGRPLGPEPPVHSRLIALFGRITPSNERIDGQDVRVREIGGRLAEVARRVADDRRRRRRAARGRIARQRRTCKRAHRAFTIPRREILDSRRSLGTISGVSS